jgi:hypothetical protein
MLVEMLQQLPQRPLWYAISVLFLRSCYLFLLQVTPAESSFTFFGTTNSNASIQVVNGKSDTTNSLPWIMSAPSIGLHYLVFTKDSLTANFGVTVLAGTFLQFREVVAYFVLGSENMLRINGSNSIALPSDNVITIPPLNVFFGDVKGNPVPTNNSRAVIGAFISYPILLYTKKAFAVVFELIMISRRVI